MNTIAKRILFILLALAGMCLQVDLISQLPPDWFRVLSPAWQLAITAVLLVSMAGNVVLAHHQKVLAERAAIENGRRYIAETLTNARTMNAKGPARADPFSLWPQFTAKQ